jgi:lipopolysaccharide export LptBFGC system permease protein LptF
MIKWYSAWAQANSLCYKPIGHELVRQLNPMKRWFQRFGANAGVLGEFVVFLWKRKLWWLIPMVMTLLLCGLLLIFASSTGLGPFIYSLF